ncbi:MAG: hypothetical protein JST00_42295 [Deltaproteobacteria bacterium]|nr:hypothetical protein [Deltaproteobacteria bacterium]
MARSSLLVLALAVGAAGAFGCYTGSHIESEPPATRTEVSPAEPSSGEVSGVPCDVAEVLARECNSCHGSFLTGGAPNSLTTYEELASASKADPKRTFAQLSVDRMKESAKPMPPSGEVKPADVEVLERWIAAGMPKGSCAAGGKSDYDTPVVCTSNTRWTRGDRGSNLMHPGMPCIDCHSTEREGPIYSVAGTLYPTAHEPDDCNGLSNASAKIVITGADGKTTTLSVNAAGNFFSRTKIAMPYKAKVVSGDKVREMKDATDNGDCNACHTEKGAEKAPGRVMAP